MKRISAIMMSFLIFSISPIASAQTATNTQAEPYGIATSTTEIIISENISKTILEKVDALNKQFSAYILRLGLVNEKLSNKLDDYSQQGLDVLEISEIVAESNSALENSKKHLINISNTQALESMESEKVIAFVYNAKSELGLAKNEIRKAQELGKIAVSKIKIMILE
jgi:alkylhydroperoxidase/carboxymuconolactone decarboxylase family protein YurZ